MWIRFENGHDPVSSFAKQLDKYQAMEKAFDYEKIREIVSTQEFIDNNGEKITNAFLVKKLQALIEKLASIKG